MGSGIGLAVAKRLVEFHGGAIRATSEGVGCGSEFMVPLPLIAHPLDAPGVPTRAPARTSLLNQAIDDVLQHTSTERPPETRRATLCKASKSIAPDDGITPVA
jgi:hypothetical protein